MSIQTLNLNVLLSLVIEATLIFHKYDCYFYTCRAKGGTTDDLKEKLLRLLLAQSSSLLLGSGCPLDEVSLK